MTDPRSRAWLWLLPILALSLLLYLLSPILMPFAAGALLAYLGNPLVQRLMRLGLSRNWAVGLTFFVLTCIVVLTLVFVTPMLWKQVLYVEAKLPSLLRWINREALPWIEQQLHININGRIDRKLINEWLSTYWTDAATLSSDMLSRVTTSGLNLLALLGMLALIPVVTFYLLLDWDMLLHRIRELLPRDIEPTVIRLAGECNEVLAAFLRGQLLVMLSLGVIYAVGLEIVGLRLALIIGLVAGLGSIIPYLGFALGIVGATVAAIIQFGDFHAVLMVWAVFAIGQAVEGWILQPYLVGDRIGLHPVAVIFAIMAGGQLFGFVGMLLALPVAAVTMVLLRHGHTLYQQSQLYQGVSRLDAVEEAADEVVAVEDGSAGR